MLWLKRCVVPTLPHEAIISDVMYPVVLLAFSQNLALPPTMVGCIQSGLWILTNSFCEIEALEDEEGNMLVDQNGDPKLKVPNPRVELPYTTW